MRKLWGKMRKWGKLCKSNEVSCEEKWGKLWGKMRKVVRKNEESYTKNTMRENFWGTFTTILRKNGGKRRKN